MGSSSTSCSVAVALWLLVLLGLGGASGELQVACPSAESTVASVVRDFSASDSTIPPALFRLQFHDCFVRGFHCDASVLIKGGTEVDIAKHQGLRAMNVIDSAKAQLEAKCPGVVSCTDILILAARDAVALTGGPSFDVPTGRRDGKVSNLRDGDVLPDGHDSAQVLRSKFAASSAHTVGTTACFFTQDRIYNFPLPGGGRGSDPSIPAGFLAELKSRCAPAPEDFDTSILRNIPANGHSDGAQASSHAPYKPRFTRPDDATEMAEGTPEGPEFSPYDHQFGMKLWWLPVGLAAAVVLGGIVWALNRKFGCV